MVARGWTGWTLLMTEISIGCQWNWFYHLNLIVTTTCDTSVTFHAKERNKKTENYRINPKTGQNIETIINKQCNAFFLISNVFEGVKFDRRQKVTKVVTIRLERERERERERAREREREETKGFLLKGKVQGVLLHIIMERTLSPTFDLEGDPLCHPPRLLGLVIMLPFMYLWSLPFVFSAEISLGNDWLFGMCFISEYCITCKLSCTTQCLTWNARHLCVCVEKCIIRFTPTFDIQHEMS